MPVELSDSSPASRRDIEALERELGFSRQHHSAPEPKSDLDGHELLKS